MHNSNLAYVLLIYFHSIDIINMYVLIHGTFFCVYPHIGMAYHLYVEATIELNGQDPKEKKHVCKSSLFPKRPSLVIIVARRAI